AETTFVVHVLLDHAPVIDGKPLPDILNVQATGPGGAAVSFTVTAHDPDNDLQSLVCSPASGSTFPIGTTTVTCTATDSQALTDSDQFDVPIVDTTGPVVSGMPGNQTKEATSAAGATATFTLPTTWNDAVDGPRTVSCNHQSGQTFPLGTTTVTCSASDSRTNSSS